MRLAYSLPADVLAPSRLLRSTTCERWSSTEWVYRGGTIKKPQAQSKSIRVTRIRAQEPDRDQGHRSSDGRGDTDRKKDVRRPVTPGQAQRAKKNIKRAVNLERVIKTATLSPGLTGSLAVLGGIWLHINPYGNLHWSPQDLAVGLACIIPLLLVDSAVMLPDHQKQSERDIEQTASRFASARAKLQAAKAGSGHSDATSSEQAVESSPSGSTSAEPMRPAAPFEEGDTQASFSGGNDAAVRMPQHSRSPLQHLRVSAQYIQGMLLQRGSKTALLPLPLDIGLTAAAKLGSSMLEFAVLFTGLSYWERDRMYELGFPDMVSVWGRSMSLQEAGQWGALAALVAGLLGLAASVQAAQERTSAAQREAMRRQLLKGKARNGVEFQMFQRGLKRSGATDPRAIASQLQSSLEASATAHNTLSAMLDNAKQERSAQAQWNAALVTVREIVGLWGVGTSFIITGNLLAPWGASVVVGVLRSGYSRVQLPRLRRRRAELLTKLTASLGDDAEASIQIMKQGGVPEPCPKGEDEEKRE